MKESNAAWWESVNKMLGPDPNQKFHDGWTEYQKDSLFTPVDTENLTQAVRPEPQAGDVGFAPVGKLGNDLASNSVEEGSITSMKSRPKTGSDASRKRDDWLKNVTDDNESGEEDPKAALHTVKKHILQGRKPKSNQRVVSEAESLVWVVLAPSGVHQGRQIPVGKGDTEHLAWIDAYGEMAADKRYMKDLRNRGVFCQQMTMADYEEMKNDGWAAS